MSGPMPEPHGQELCEDRPVSTIETDVAVVGAGIAGLTAADALVSAGPRRRRAGGARPRRRPHVEHRDRRPGERARRPVDRPLPDRRARAAPTIWDWSSSTPTAKATASTSTRRAAHPLRGSRRAARRRLRAGLRGRRGEARRPRRRARPRGALGPPATPPSSTRSPTRPGCSARCDDDHRTRHAARLLAGGFMTKPSHTFSLLGGLWVIAGAGSVDNLFEPDLCLHSRVVGGSQLIPIRLAERLGERVRARRAREDVPLERTASVDAGGATTVRGPSGGRRRSRRTSPAASASSPRCPRGAAGWSRASRRAA